MKKNMDVKYYLIIFQCPPDVTRLVLECIEFTFVLIDGIFY